ncbi:THAP domain-containing protein 5-like [Lissotriton helveticus]
MTRYCVAQRCSRDQRRRDGRGRAVTFHKFPKDPELRRRWVLAVQHNTKHGDLWQPSSYSALCSLHFTEECMDRTGQTVRIWKGAVPTLFNEPQHEQETVPSPQAAQNSLMIAERTSVGGRVLTKWKQTPSQASNEDSLVKRSPMRTSKSCETQQIGVQNQIDLTGDDPVENTVHEAHPASKHVPREDCAAHLQESSFICNTCGKNITGYSLFMQHLKIHNSELSRFGKSYGYKV